MGRFFCMLAGLLLLPGAPWAAETIGYDQIVVVTVAIGQQPGWDALPNAARDVQLFHEALAGPSDAPIHIIHLDDATATREGILEALDQAATEAGKRDRSLLIFYFAGHGETYKNQGYIVPVGGRKDAFSTWLSVDALKTASKAAPVRHQLFILGSCFGGALIQRGRDLSVAELKKQELAATWRAGELGRVAHVALAAGNERQKIPDGTPGEGSAFGRAVATALRASAKGRAADYNSDGCVDRYELAAYVSAHGRTPANSPRIGPLPDDDAGILALCQGRYDTPPRVTPWGPTRGGWTAGQEVAREAAAANGGAPPPGSANREIGPDNDLDGILDTNDHCDLDPEDKDGFEDHDGCPDPDNDLDGILDVDDKCPNDPEDKDGFEDHDGCPDPDNDLDGILDMDDKCPNDPEDKDDFEDHDGCPDPDNDVDGILDVDDRCPNDPEDKDGFEDHDGCPDLDHDFDGILGLDDKCPLQPETFNGVDDLDGCPDQGGKVKLTCEEITFREQVVFDANTAIIRKVSFDLLDQVSSVLKSAKFVTKVRVEGHTDSRDKEAKNKKLSQDRAESVRKYLIDRGISSNRLEAVGYGEERPIATNKTAAGRRQNRRVAFTVTERSSDCK